MSPSENVVFLRELGPFAGPFGYAQGRLSTGGIDVSSIAGEVGTPCFIYDGDAIAGAYDAFSGALRSRGLDAQVCYALKANPHLAVVTLLARRGAGADVVSEGELARAVAAGIPGERIVFAGVGKTEAEMAAGLEAGILQFNVESVEELLVLNRVAREKGRTAPVALRLNPDVDARTHAKITTGKSENKFGIPLDHARTVLATARELEHVRVESLAMHIGSQLTSLEPYGEAFRRLGRLFVELRSEGWPLDRLDLGGGLGIAYHGAPAPDPEAYAALVAEAVGDLGVPLLFEPGRHLVGAAGVLVTRVLFVKQGLSHTFVIVDAAMNDLIRPALYDAWHEIRPLRQPDADEVWAEAEIVGPVCESGDRFAAGRPLPPVAPGDLLAVFSAGAYGATMASTYNSRLPAPEVLVAGGQWSVIRERPDHAAMMARERVPTSLLERSGT